MASDNPKKAELRQHRENADALEKAGDWVNAVGEREKAYALAPRQGTRMQLVDALSHAGETERSYRLLLEALADGPVGARPIRRGFHQAVELGDRDALPMFAERLAALLAAPDEQRPKKPRMSIWHALVWLGEIDIALGHMDAPAPVAAAAGDTPSPRAVVVDPGFAPDTGQGHNFNNNLFYLHRFATLGLPGVFYGATDAGAPPQALGFDFRPALTTRMYTGEIPFDDLQWHRNVNRYFEVELDRQIPADDRLFVFHTMRNTTILGMANWMLRRHADDGSSLIVGIVDSNLGAHPSRAGIVRAIYAETFAALKQLGKVDLLIYCETQSQIDTLRELGGDTFDIRLFPYVAAGLALEHATPRAAASDGPLRLGYLGATREERGADLIPALVHETRKAFGDRIGWTVQLDPGGLARLAERPVDEAIAMLRDDPGVELIDGKVSTENYFAMLDRMDIVVLPYRQRYEVSGSGVFVEALSLGKVLVVPRRGWMADFARRYGNEPATFDDASPDSVLAAVREAIDRHADLSQRALAAADSWNAAQGSAAEIGRWLQDRVAGSG